ncbi:MAG: hypothetical protein AAFO62_06360, partial [Pseudomonadota bacterium]
MSYGFAPLLPVTAIAAIGIVFALTALFRLRMSWSGALLRLLAGAAAVLFLLGPETIRQTFDSLPDQALILLDESGSMGLGGREEIRDQTADALRAQLEERGIDVVTARFGDGDASPFGQGLSEALAGTERSQLSGIFVLTDGQVDGAEEAAARPLPAPVHGILIGNPERDQDRHLSWVSSPRFGLVGEPMTLQFKIDDTENTALIPLTLRIDGEVLLTRNVPTGEVVTIEVPMTRPGERIVDLSIPSTREELSTRNNAVTARVNVIRDRLRVLLISGEPHAG